MLLRFPALTAADLETLSAFLAQRGIAVEVVRGRQRRCAAERAIRFPGIVQAARKLGVERTHLYRVLAGERQSRRLSAAYRDFLAAAR